MTDNTMYRSNIPSLDKRTCGFKPGDLVVITGESCAGKTQLGFQLFAEVIRQGGAGVAYSGDSIMPTHEILTKLALPRGIYMRLSGDKYGNPVYTWDNAAKNKLKEKIRDRCYLASAEHLFDTARELSSKSKLNAILIDSLLQFNLRAEPDAQVMAKLKEFAVCHNCIVFVVVHSPRYNHYFDDHPAAAFETIKTADIVISIGRYESEEIPEAASIIRVLRDRDGYSTSRIWESPSHLSETERRYAPILLTREDGTNRVTEVSFC